MDARRSHIGALTPAWWGKRWIDRANALAPDAILYVGGLQIENECPLVCIDQGLTLAGP